MLTIIVPATELFDEKNNEFITFKGQTLQLEHSLVSISKWESKWKKAFLSKKEKTEEETLDYIRCMTITQNVNPIAYYCLTDTNKIEINKYIDDPMTATVFNKMGRQGPQSRDTITSELIYFWMVSYNIPFECQKWHINRLLTLIRVCNIKNDPPKKRRSGDVAREYASLNAARRKKFNTKG